VDAKDYERGSLYKFFPEDIIVELGENGRHEEPDIEWLIADIHARGQETAVTVRSDGGKPVLVFGYQRLRAVFEVNKRWPDEPKRKVICIFKDLGKEEAFRANIAENRMRNETTPVDDAHNIKRLMNVYGYSDERIIDAYFPDLIMLPRGGGKRYEDAKRWVRERMAIIGLTPTAEKAVREGKVKLHTAIALNKLPAEKQDEIVAAPGPIKGRVVAKAVQESAAKPKTRKKKESPAVKAFAASNAARLVNALAGEDDELELPKFANESVNNLANEMISALGEALWNPDRDKKPREELLVMADAILQAAAEASAQYDFTTEVLDAMEVYRKARVA
jgi:ParB-like chromosome segregation protein Spo0J